MATQQGFTMRTASASCCALVVVAAVSALAAEARDEPLPAAAWYRFESRDELGRSSGVTPWPAYVFRAEAGAGKHGGGLILPGRAANGLLLPNPPAFFGSTARVGTIALWVQPDFDPAKETGQRVIVDFMKETRNTKTDGYEVMILTDRDKLAAQAALGRRMVVPTPLARGRWTHIALAWDAELGAALYINGRRAAERKGRFKPTPLTSWPGRLGSHTPSGGYPFKGTLDELRLFRAKLGPDEIAALVRAGDAELKLDVAGWDGDALKVTNRGAEPVRVWLREWLAEPGGEGSRWGYLPLPEHEVGSRRVHVGGAAGKVQNATAAVRVAPGKAVSLQMPRHPNYIGRHRLSLMAGEGVDCQEVSARDRQGLLFTTEPRILFSGRPARVRLLVRNDTGRRCQGVLKVKLCRQTGERISVPSVRTLRLREGKTASFEIRLADAPLPVGSYRLELTTFATGARSVPSRALPIHVTEPADHKSIVGVAAAFVPYPPSNRLLRATALDGA